MKDKELEKIGIIKDGGKIHPNKYWCNATQCNITIFESTTIEDIFELIYNVGESNGILEGKRRRSYEFMELLNPE